MSKKYRKPKPTRTLNKPANKPKPAEKPAISMQWLIIGAVALVAVVAFTLVMIFVYDNPTVARVNGTAIRHNQVVEEINTNEDIQEALGWGMASWEDAKQHAVWMVALTQLYEDFANDNDINIPRGQSSEEIRDYVTDRIIGDTLHFAPFLEHLQRDMPTALGIAEEIYARAQAGEDFDMLIETYGEDPGMVGNLDGYVFIEGVMVQEFFETTRSLDIGQISAPVQTTHGYHVILRVEPAADAMVMVPGGQQPQPLETDDEILGAKHVLIQASADTLTDRRRRAVATGFNEMMFGANLEFTGALDNIRE